MPYYRGDAVGDSFLQSLIGAYRSANKYADAADGPIIARLESAGVSNVGGAASVGDADRYEHDLPNLREAYGQEQLKVIRADTSNVPKELKADSGAWSGDDAAIAEYFAAHGVDLAAVPPGWVPPATATYSSDAGKVSAVSLVPQRSQAELIANYQRSIYAVPSAATSGPPGPNGYSSGPGTDTYGGGLSPSPGIIPMSGGFDMMTIGILAAMGLAAFFLLRK